MATVNVSSLFPDGTTSVISWRNIICYQSTLCHTLVTNLTGTRELRNFRRTNSPWNQQLIKHSTHHKCECRYSRTLLAESRFRGHILWCNVGPGRIHLVIYEMNLLQTILLLIHHNHGLMFGKDLDQGADGGLKRFSTFSLISLGILVTNIRHIKGTDIYMMLDGI